MDTSFGRDLLALDRALVEECRLFFSGQMIDVQAGAFLPRHLHSTGRREVTGFFAPDPRMPVHRNVCSKPLTGRFQIVLNGRLVLAMGDDQLIQFSEQTFQHLFIVHEHIPGTRAHEHLDSREASLFKALEFLQIFIARANIETKIGHRAFGCPCVFLLHCFGGQCRWARIGLLDVRGYTARNSRSRFRSYFRLVGESGLTKVHLIIDQTRQDPHPRSVYDLFIGSGADVLLHAFDALTFDEHIFDLRTTLIDHEAILDEHFTALFLRHLFVGNACQKGS